MFSLRSYYFRMTLFIGCIAGLAVLLQHPLISAFKNNLALNGLITAVLVFGVVLAFYNLSQLQKDVSWLDAYDAGKDHLPGVPKPNVLAPLAVLLRENTAISSLNATTTRTLLNAIEGRLESFRDVARYLIGLLIFLGLLGTFWGLTQTISAIAGVIHGMDVAGGDFAQAFKDLKSGLQSPLAGMGTAFSCSLLGLSGSLILGFLDLQWSKASTRFYQMIEERLATVTRISGSNDTETTHSGPAYGIGLFEQAVEGMNQLQTLIKRGEENRTSIVKSLQTLSEKVSLLGDQLSLNQAVVKKMTDQQDALTQSLLGLAKTLEAANVSDDEGFKTHLRNIDVTLHQLLEESIEGRNRLSTDVRNEIRLVARTISALADGQEVAA